MIKTIEVIIAIVLMLTLVFFALRVSDVPNKPLTDLKTTGETTLKSLALQNSFRANVLADNVDAVKADLNALIQTALEVQICDNLGSANDSCVGSLPDSNNFTTINYLISGSEEATNPKTIRLFLWVTRNA